MWLGADAAQLTFSDFKVTEVNADCSVKTMWRTSLESGAACRPPGAGMRGAGGASPQHDASAYRHSPSLRVHIVTAYRCVSTGIQQAHHCVSAFAYVYTCVALVCRHHNSMEMACATMCFGYLDVY